MGKTKKKSGVVAYRLNAENEMEVLLVSARKFKDSWVFPVGTVEKNESLKEAAARECLEESGYEVEIEKKVDSITVENKGSTNEFTFYKAKIIGEHENYEDDRKRIWVTIDKLSEKIAPLFLPIVFSFIKLHQK